MAIEKEFTYQEAAIEIENRFAKLEIETIFSDARKHVETIEKKEYVSYKFDVEFRHKNDTLKIDYGMGLGCFPKGVVIGNSKNNYRDQFQLLWDNYKDVHVAKNKHISFFAHCYKDTIPTKFVQMNITASKIFACICREGFDAISYSLDDWCTEFYGNIDSRKGAESHKVCLDRYIWLRQHFGEEIISDFAELSNML